MGPLRLKNPEQLFLAGGGHDNLRQNRGQSARRLSEIQIACAPPGPPLFPPDPLALSEEQNREGGRGARAHVSLAKFKFTISPQAAPLVSADARLHLVLATVVF